MEIKWGIIADEIWDEILFLRGKIDDFDDDLIETYHDLEIHDQIFRAYEAVNLLLLQWSKIQSLIWNKIPDDEITTPNPSTHPLTEGGDAEDFVDGEHKRRTQE